MLEAADTSTRRARERAALMSEELAFDQLFGDRGHVDGDEAAVAALAVIVQRARDKLLAGSGFARDHHGQIGLGQAGDDAIDLLHSRRAADQRQALVAGFWLRNDALAFVRCERALDDRGEFLQVEGLGQIFICAALGRRDRRQDIVLRAHHHDGELWPQPLDAGKEVERVFVGQDHVRDDEIAFALRHPTPQPGGIGCRAHVVTGAPQSLIEHCADRGVVVANQDRAFRHKHPRVCRSSPRCSRQPAGGSGRACAAAAIRIRSRRHGRR